MLQTLKVGFLRRYFRFSAWLAWRSTRTPANVEAVTLNTRAGPRPGRLYRGEQDAQRPLVVYFHGGGWVIGDLDTHDAYCLMLAQQSAATVVAVDYRLAPEAVFPAAQNDCLDAASDIATRIGEFGGNGQIVLAGDSAGGHLSLMSALNADAELREKLSGIIATYPVADHYSQPYASYVECATGQALTMNLMRWFWDTYMGSAQPDAASIAQASPLRHPGLATLPPLIGCTAGRDPLRDEGIALRDALKTAGVDVEYHHYPNSEHGFAGSMGATDDFNDWLQRCSDWIGRQA
ncbi:MAG: alpha/beta hydrolase [Congregibacter sp.]